MAVLITCALGADAYKLKARLSGNQILIGDYNDIPEFMIKSGQIIKLPSPKNAAYQHEMLSLCLDIGIDTIYPLSTVERNALSESMQLFAEYGITLKDIPDGL